MSRLDRLLRPQTIAILGGAWADTVAEQCAKLGFAGRLWRVHPNRLSAYRRIEDLPEPPDAVFLGVNRHATIELTQALKKAGAGGAVAFASGFAETADGAQDLTNDLIKAAGDMPVLGPNCYGMVNFFDHASLFPDQVPVRATGRGVAVICQSGTFGCNMLYAGRSLPLGYVITIGNQALVGTVELIEAVLKDPRVSAVGLYLESLPDLAALRDAIAETELPIVLCKAGRSETAKRTALSHCGAMGSKEAYLDLAFERLGIARTSTTAEFIETLKLAHLHGRLPGNRLVLCGASGGDLAMAADQADALGLTFPKLPDHLHKSLQERAKAPVSVANPFDFQTQIWHDPQAMHALFQELMTSEADCFGFILDHPDPREFNSSLFRAAADAFVDAAQSCGKPAVMISMLAETTPRDLREAAIDQGVVPLQGLFEGLAAIAHMSRLKGQTPAFAKKANGPVVDLSEAEAKAILKQRGLKIPEGQIVQPSEAGAYAATIGFPVVLKRTGIAHKSDSGGVILGLNDRQSVDAQAPLLGPQVLVEAMVTDGVAELIIGVDFDPDAGPVIMIGAGGIGAEWLDDKQFLLPPLNPEMVDHAVRSLKINALIDGYRGKPKGDRKAVIDAVMAIDQWLAEKPGHIIELDINPLIVRPEGLGAVAADALLRTIELGDLA